MSFFCPSRLVFAHRETPGASLVEDERSGSERPRIRVDSGFIGKPPASFFENQLSRYLERAPEEEREALSDPKLREEVLDELNRFTAVMPVLERVSDVTDQESGRFSMSESMSLKDAVIRDRLKSACRIAALKAQNSALRDENEVLSGEVESLKTQVTIDPLTQIANHRGYEEAVKRSIELAKRAGVDLSMLMIDVDRFKFINDSFGHPVGNEVLKEVARRLQANVRGSDTIARVGGEEFIALIHGGRDTSELTDGNGLSLAAHRLKEAVSSEPFIVNARRGSKPLLITISIGGTRFLVSAQDTKKAMEERADEYMYQAKKAGRNRVFIEGQEVQSKDLVGVPKPVNDQDLGYIKVSGE